MVVLPWRFWCGSVSVVVVPLWFWCRLYAFAVHVLSVGEYGTEMDLLPTCLQTAKSSRVYEADDQSSLGVLCRVLDPYVQM